MAGDHAEVRCLIVDCRDPKRVARFWSALLGRPIAGTTGPYVWLERRNDLMVGFQKVAEPKTCKNRLHLDLGSSDPVSEGRRVESLGGRRAPGYESGGFLVMADPEGNEFCVIPRDPFDLDDEGRASYLGKHVPSPPDQ